MKSYSAIIYLGFILIFTLTGFGLAAYAQQPATADVIPPALVGDAARGEMLFSTATNGAPTCSGCHATTDGFRLRGGAVAPNLMGVAGRAGERIDGVSAETYLLESIIDPGAYVVEGFGDYMYAAFGDHLSEQDAADLVAYLMTLE